MKLMRGVQELDCSKPHSTRYVKRERFSETRIVGVNILKRGSRGESVPDEAPDGPKRTRRPVRSQAPRERAQHTMTSTHTMIMDEESLTRMMAAAFAMARSDEPAAAAAPRPWVQHR